MNGIFFPRSQRQDLTADRGFTLDAEYANDQSVFWTLLCISLTNENNHVMMRGIYSMAIYTVMIPFYFDQYMQTDGQKETGGKKGGRERVIEFI